ncbi:MAG: hypothetical protein U5L09_05825 [Bacteroidales bacterium]|nr:hypothetical protein [Bacteroidales bacterium]
MKNLPHRKGYYPERKIVVYDYDAGKGRKIRPSLLLDAGFEDVSSYHHYVTGWSPDQELPMHSLARYQQLVSPQWVDDLL